MSSTNRGAERVEADNYPTPAWCVHRLLEACQLPQGIWIEPCAGEGAILDALHPSAMGPDGKLWAVELREECRDVLRGKADNVSIADLRDVTFLQNADVVITNPPFSIWHDVARWGLRHRARRTALLLRVGAIAHLDGLPIPSLYVLPNRPQFVASWTCAGVKLAGEVPSSVEPCGWGEYRDPHESTKGKRCPKCAGKIQRTASDSAEYAWFVWGEPTPIVHVLPETPLDERKAA